MPQPLYCNVVFCPCSLQPIQIQPSVNVDVAAVAAGGLYVGRIAVIAIAAEKLRRFDVLHVLASGDML